MPNTPRLQSRGLLPCKPHRKARISRAVLWNLTGEEKNNYFLWRSRASFPVYFHLKNSNLSRRYDPMIKRKIENRIAYFVDLVNKSGELLGFHDDLPDETRFFRFHEMLIFSPSSRDWISRGRSAFPSLLATTFDVSYVLFYLWNTTKSQTAKII